MLGGWDVIADDSDVRCVSVEQLWQLLSVEHPGHPRYTEALGATMVLYPELKSYAYRAELSTR